MKVLQGCTIEEGDREVNEISIPNFLYPLVTCIYLVIFTEHISPIVNKKATFNRSNFTSTA